MDTRYDSLRAIITRLGVTPLSRLVTEPGVMGIYRLTRYHTTVYLRHMVATLVHQRPEHVRLERVYEGLFEHRPMTDTIPLQRYQALVKALQGAQLDRLSDQPGKGLDAGGLWLLERASGTFHHSLILLPAHAEKPYTLISNAIADYLPEALRDVRI